MVPSSGIKKPNPFLASNHFTVPVTLDASLKKRVANADGRVVRVDAVMAVRMVDFAMRLNMIDVLFRVGLLDLLYGMNVWGQRRTTDCHRRSVKYLTLCGKNS